MEYGPLPRDKASLDELLPLYKQTGEKNGFCVLGEADFYEFHQNTPDLTVLTIRVGGVGRWGKGGRGWGGPVGEGRVHGWAVRSGEGMGG